MESKYVWMNGKLVEFEKATVHLLTPALHYGAAVFEGIRCYETEEGPAIFRLKDHVDRLWRSAQTFGLRSLPFDRGEICAAVKETVRANGFSECYIRPLVYLSQGGWNLNVDAAACGVAVAVWPWKEYFGKDALENGIRANVSSFTRHHPNVTMTKAKVAGNYVNSFLAKTESVRLGFDEAIQLDPQGYVAECTGENLFVVRGGTLVTPGTASVLEGITRDTVMTLARDLDFDVIESALSRDQLYQADEVFVCGTAAECIALREIDFRVIGTGRTGPVTRAIQRAYQDAVRGRHERSRQWLDHVAQPEKGGVRHAQADPVA